MERNPPQPLELMIDYCWDAFHVTRSFVKRTEKALKEGDFEEASNQLKHAGISYAGGREMLSHLQNLDLPDLKYGKLLPELRVQFRHVRKQLIQLGREIDERSSRSG